MLGVDPKCEAPPGVSPCDLRTALAASDYLMLAVPLAADTSHLIGGDALKHMKLDALLVNVGRGSVRERRGGRSRTRQARRLWPTYSKWRIGRVRPGRV
jgi:phosphoglycerate dehydrogenase-like enzyme